MPSWPTAVSGMLAAGYAATQAQKVGLDSFVGSLSRSFTGGGDSGASFSGRGAGSGTGEASAAGVGVG